VAWALLLCLIVELIKQTEGMLVKIDLVTVLATLNALLRQVSTSLPKIREATGGLLQKENLNRASAKANGLAKAGV
jgi:hypothetical protein